MTQKKLLERRLGLKMQESILVQDEIHFLQDAIASISHEPTLQDREDFFKSEIDETTCKKCGGRMQPGKAIEQTYSGVPDFPGGGVVTVSPDGRGELVNCSKCSLCGWSVTE